MSATRCEDGSYQIDPAELYRVFPLPVPQPAASNTTQPSSERDGTLRMQLEVAERERDREREERNREREQMQATIDDLRTRLDRAESRIAGLLPAPPVRQGRWRLWGRG